MDKTQLVPACVYALEHEPDLRTEILRVAPGVTVAAGKLAASGSRHPDGLVTRDFHLAVATLNQRIPELWDWAQTRPAQIERCAAAHREAVARHRKNRRREPKQLPTLMQQARNLAKAVAGEASAVAKGVKPVTPDEKRARLAVCAACPERIVQDGHARCAACGCFLERKTAWRSQSCPLGKWTALVDTGSRA